MGKGWFKRTLPHICMIMAVLLLTLLALDQLDSGLFFLNNTLTKILLLIYNILVIIMACGIIARRYRNANKGR